jgi:hypothetical protein
MTEEPLLIEKLFTAARRYVQQRMGSFEQLHWKVGGVFSITPELVELDAFMDTMPRIQFLSGVNWEIIALNASDMAGLTEARELLNMAAEIRLNGCLRSTENEIAINGVQQEYKAFIDHIQSLDNQMLQAVEPLPYMRSLPLSEYKARLKSFGERWGIDMSQGWIMRDYYPVTPLSPNPPVLEAFDAQAIVDANGTQRVQRLLRENGVSRVYIFEENYPAIECDVSSLNLARAIPRIVSYIFSDALDWMIYTSWDGTVTIGGTWLLEQIKSEWKEWQKHRVEYFDPNELTFD